MLPMYDHKLFNDFFESAQDFINNYVVDENLEKPITDDNAAILFYLLTGRYGNNPICNMSENQFRVKIYSVIFQYGPSWEKELEIQKALRDLNVEDIIAGDKQINNHSFNPSIAPTTDTIDELTTINEQNVTKYKRSKLGGYARLLDLLKSDVTENFLNRFKTLFLQVVEPDIEHIYVTDEEEEQ